MMFFSHPFDFPASSFVISSYFLKKKKSLPPLPASTQKAYSEGRVRNCLGKLPSELPSELLCLLAGVLVLVVQIKQETL